MGLVGQFLQREQMFKDQTTRLKQVVREAFLSISRLENSKAVRVTKARVKPATHHQVRKHIDLISA